LLKRRNNNLINKNKLIRKQPIKKWNFKNLMKKKKPYFRLKNKQKINNLNTINKNKRNAFENTINPINNLSPNSFMNKLKSNNVDFEMLKKLLASNKKPTSNESNGFEHITRNNNIKENDNIILNNIANKRGIIRKNNRQFDKFRSLQHNSHQKLNYEVNQLMEKIKQLKFKQKGFLAQNETKSNINLRQNDFEKNKINNNLATINNSSAKQNDSTLSEIEKQIKLLNSLNLNQANK